MRSPVAAGAAEFTAYDASHVGALVVLVLGGVALVMTGRQLRESDPRDRLGTVLAAGILLTTVPLQVLYFTPDYWNLRTTLPIQLCDLASFVSAYALWTHRWWATGLAYYWGLTLTTQAIATPSLTTPFPEPLFWLYWGMHVTTVWAAAYLAFGRGLGPDWRSYRVAMAATAAWAVTVYCFNLAAGTNYGYLNRKPGVTSILDLLGPWPWYVGAEIAIIAVVWALLTWPWVAGGRSAPRTG